MPKELWLNLPVRDLNKSKAFFTHLGFSFHPRHHNSNDAAGLLIGDLPNIVMLFPEATFKTFTKNEIADTKQGTEVLFSIDAANKEEVDTMVQLALEAGGTVISKPQGQNGMYGAVFADLDGHRWNLLFMG